MAGTPRVYYRNYNKEDSTNIIYGYAEDAVVSIETIGFEAPDGYSFLEWNTKRDGTGISLEIGSSYYWIENAFAIWKEAADQDYLTKKSELTSIANAIRAKGGTSNHLTFPAGFISAIEAISTKSSEVPTRPVSITSNDANIIFYTDATMTVVSTSSVNFSNILMPIGTLLVEVKNLSTEPEPYATAPIRTGIELIQQYNISYNSIKIYKVIE